MKILIVDDSATIRAGMRSLVEKMGHSAIEADDGDKALSMYLRDRPDLVLIDAVMPVMDGYEAARRMRKSGPDEWVPIIFLSSKEDDQDLVLNAKIRALHRIETMRSKVIEVSRDLATANRELEKLSRQDGLTGIANRRYFDSYLQTEVRRAARERSPLSLILSDVDNFKAFNDCYGHQAGDDCLRQVATALSSAGRRPADLAARYGGEEFAMILPGTVVDGAVDVAQSVVRVIAGLAIPHARSGAGQITISQGIMSLVPEKETSPEDLIHRADQALYQAKQQGRNRCVVFGENESRGSAAASSS